MLLVQPCDAAHTSNAKRMTSTIRCDVSTFPPTTAAVSEGSSRQPFGILTFTGLRQPYNGKIPQKQHIHVTRHENHEYLIDRSNYDVHLVKRYVMSNHASQTVNNCTHRHSARRIRVSKHFKSCAHKVKQCCTLNTRQTISLYF